MMDIFLSLILLGLCLTICVLNFKNYKIQVALSERLGELNGTRSDAIRKFSWLPKILYKSEYGRDGFIWLGFYWEGRDGKNYSTPFEAQ